MLNTVLVKLEVYTPKSLLREKENMPVAFTKDEPSPVRWHLWVWLGRSTFLALEQKGGRLLKVSLRVGSVASLQTGTNMRRG